MKGELDLGDVAAGHDAPEAETEGDHAPVLERFREALSGRIKDVRVTRRLSTSPACLVSEEFEMSRHLERILDAAGQKIDGARPILEINPDHPMVARLAAETEVSRQQDWAHLIFDQALLSEGGKLEDPAGFVRRMNELIVTLAQGGGSAPARRRAKKAATKKAAGAGTKAAKKASRKPAAKGAAKAAGTTSKPDAG